MTKRGVYFFENPGEENTQAVIEVVAKRAEETDVEAIVLLPSLVRPHQTC